MLDKIRTLIRFFQSRSILGFTVVELLVVTMILTLLASLTLPVSQLQKQREKENQLKEILFYVRSNGIGLGTITKPSGDAYVNSSLGYRNFIIKKLYSKIGVEPGFTEASATFAIASATQMGTIFPKSPAMLEFPVGYVASISTDNNGGYTLVKITHRFIRKIPPHPFKDWYPNARWEFRAATYDPAYPGPWFTFENWPTNHATGVMDIRSVGAGISINGESTDEW